MKQLPPTCCDGAQVSAGVQSKYASKSEASARAHRTTTSTALLRLGVTGALHPARLAASSVPATCLAGRPSAQLFITARFQNSLKPQVPRKT